MKRIICLALVVVLCLTALVACGDKEKNYTLGLGVQFGDLTSGETSATIAAVVLDEDGKIVSCRIDAIQNKYSVGEAVDFSNLKTKMELGDEYGMAAAVNYGMDWNGDGVVKEWYDQVKAFENYVVGKTASEVEAMGTKEVEGKGYVISSDDALLSAGCTIQISDFKAAVVKACNDAYKVSFKAKDFTLGIAANSANDGSSITDGVATVKMNCDIAASVVVDGKIVANINDAIQPQVVIDAEGNVTSKSVGKGEGVLKTKRELGNDYGMAPALGYGMDWNGDGVVKEWYEQSQVFSANVVGKTAADVEAMGTKVVEGKGYVISNDDALLSAGCTIQITGLKAVVAESVTNAR